MCACPFDCKSYNFNLKQYESLLRTGAKTNKQKRTHSCLRLSHKRIVELCCLRNLQHASQERGEKTYNAKEMFKRSKKKQSQKL